MGQIQIIVSRLTPMLVVWMGVALVGVVVTALTMRLIRRLLLAPVARHPSVRAMLRQNLLFVVAFCLMQLVALGIALGVIFAVLQGDILGWAVVAMNVTVVGFSVSQFVQIHRAAADTGDTPQ